MSKVNQAVEDYKDAMRKVDKARNKFNENQVQGRELQRELRDAEGDAVTLKGRLDKAIEEEVAGL